jgi:hypothetical protein
VLLEKLVLLVRPEKLGLLEKQVLLEKLGQPEKQVLLVLLVLPGLLAQQGLRVMEKLVQRVQPEQLEMMVLPGQLEMTVLLVPLGMMVQLGVREQRVHRDRWDQPVRDLAV